MERTDAEGPRLEQRAITALTLLSLFLSVLPQFYEPLGWPGGHRVAGTMLAVAVFGGGAALSKPIRTRGRRVASNVVVVLALVGAVVLPYLLHEALVVAGRPDPVTWSHGDLLTVPSLADDEPVRGTGCGAHNTTRVTRSTIPDGTWFGAIRSVDGGTGLTFDLICVYASETKAATNPSYAELDAAGAIVRHPALHPTWVALNANSLVRTVPMAPNFQYREAVWSSTGGCADAGERRPVQTGVDVWLVIEGGRAVLAERLCDLDSVPNG